MSGPRILVLDIERLPTWTKPLPVWSMKDLQRKYLTAADIDTWGRTICLAYQWLDERKVQFIAEWEEGGRTGFLRKAWELYDQADVVVGHNSIGFDTKHLQGEWNLEGFGPPSPVKEIDTLLTARQNFNYEANHLAVLTQRLGIPTKNDKYRIDVAMGAVNGDEKLQRRITRYNKGDVTATKGLYLHLRPWTKANLNVFFDDEEGTLRCPSCSSLKVQRRGVAATTLGRYARYQCQNCAKWGKGKRMLAGSVEVRPA